MLILFSLPFMLLSVALAFDEFYFHRKRGLPLWERVSHPFDTLTVLFCFSYLYFFPWSQANLRVYGCLALFSCISITKDEFVHSEQCDPAELWLHSILFILHPLMLVSAGYLWSTQNHLEILGLQSVMAGIFFLYQIIRWPLKTVS